MNNFITELRAKMASNSGVIHINEQDELRLETKCRRAAASSGYNLFRWTQTDGLIPVTDVELDDLERQKLAGLVDPVGGLLVTVKDWQLGPSVVLAFDLITLVNRLPTLPIGCRLIKDITDRQQQAEATDAGTAETGVCQLILCDRESLQLDTPVQRMQLELPDRAEMSGILDSILLATDPEIKDTAEQDRDRILNSLAGLPAYQAGNAISESIVRLGKVDASLLKEYKKELVQAKGITWIETDDQGFDALGGLTPLKDWLKKRAAVMMDDDLRAQYGIGMPKGIICAGIAGAGKSAAARSLAGFLGVPLLAVDLGAARNLYQGASEENVRTILNVIESVPCVILLDEAEKQLGGSTGQGAQADGGTSSRILSTLLTWMQENNSKSFLYMTANRPNEIPVELMRAGRTSGQFWFDFPTKNELRAIIDVMKRRYPRAGSVDVEQVLAACSYHTGAEVETSFEETAIAAMTGKRDMTTEDVVVELSRVSKVKDTFQMTPELEKWKNAAQPANDPEENSNVASTPKRRRIGKLS